MNKLLNYSLLLVVAVRIFIYRYDDPNNAQTGAQESRRSSRKSNRRFAVMIK